MQQQTSYTSGDLHNMSLDASTPSQLPVGQMSVFDRITKISAEGGLYNKGEIIAEYDILPDHWYFDCHFPRDPVMPGCLGLDGLWQLSGFFLSWAGYEGKGRALGCGEVKFFGEVLPTSNLVTYKVFPRRIINKDMTMLISDGEVWADGEQIYSAKSLRVALLTGQNKGN